MSKNKGSNNTKVNKNNTRSLRSSAYGAVRSGFKGLANLLGLRERKNKLTIRA